jgi:hypothetical protein
MDQILRIAEYSGRHLKKWLLQPLEAKYVVIKYQDLLTMYLSKSVLNLVLLSQNAQ